MLIGLDNWSNAVRSTSADEWNRFHTAVTSAISIRRVEKVLGEFLARIGLSAKVSSEDVAHVWIHNLRIRIIYYREGETIEAYQHHLVAPPMIEI